MRRPIRVYTVCIKYIFFSKNGIIKNYLDTPSVGNGPVQTVKEEMSTGWVKRKTMSHIGWPLAKWFCGYSNDLCLVFVHKFDVAVQKLAEKQRNVHNENSIHQNFIT